MSRLRDVLAATADRGEKAMGLFITSGFPDLESTLPILRAMDRGGADFIEVGMPFSDPLAEGLPIQRASERALRKGARMRDVFSTARAFREESNTPLLLMGYVNPIYRYGIRAFCRDAREAGIDGLILVDLPLEENGTISGEARAAELSMVHLIAPNTPDERITAIDEMTTGFVYAVSITGLTGAELGAVESVEEYLRRARALVKQNALLVGFGIRSHEDAARLSESTDGFLVGTALVNLVERLWDAGDLELSDRLEQIEAFARTLKHGTEVSAR